MSMLMSASSLGILGELWAYHRNVHLVEWAYNDEWKMRGRGEVDDQIRKGERKDTCQHAAQFLPAPGEANIFIEDSQPAIHTTSLDSIHLSTPTQAAKQFYTQVS